MRCDQVFLTDRELNSRPRTAGMACAGCGCTDDAACEGGCFWVTLEPLPLCSQCVTPEAEEAGGSFFGAERCPASSTGAGHAQIWLNEISGYCARCQAGFVT